MMMILMMMMTKMILMTMMIMIPQRSISASSSGLLHSLRCRRQLGSRSSSETKWNQSKKHLISINIFAIERARVGGGEDSETFQFGQALMRPHKPLTRFPPNSPSLLNPPAPHSCIFSAFHSNLFMPHTNHTPAISESFGKALGEVTKVMIFLPDNHKKGIFLIVD